MTKAYCSLLTIALLAIISSGCTAGPAVLDLISISDHGLVEAKQIQTETHTEIMESYVQRLKALDRAFDKDVSAAFAGNIINPKTDVPLVPTAQWIIDTNKGMSIAKRIINQEQVKLQAVYNVRQDNLLAALEANNMARILTIQSYNLGAHMEMMLNKYSSTWRTTGGDNREAALTKILKIKQPAPQPLAIWKPKPKTLETKTP